MKKFVVILGIIIPVLAHAQSIPNGGTITQGQVWSPSQWGDAWESKVDTSSGVATGLTLIAPALGTPVSGNLLNAVGLPLSTGVTGTLQSAQEPAHTGDMTNQAGSLTTSVVSVNGVKYPLTPGTSTVPVVTGSNVVTYEAVPNAALANSSMTIAGHTVSLGGSQAIAAGDLSNGVTGSGSIVLNASPNITGPLNINGANGIALGTETINIPIFIGPGAGASFPLSTGFWALGIGYQSLSSLTNPSSEDTCGGTLSCQYVTTGTMLTAWGLHDLGFETTAQDITCGGTDCDRNGGGDSNSSGYGVSSLRDGTAVADTAFGTNTIRGNSSTLTIGGSATAGDTIAVAITSAAAAPFVPSPSSVTTTPCVITAGESLSSMRACLEAAINAVNMTGNGVALSALQWGGAGDPGNIISLDFPGTQSTVWKLTFTPVITGAGTETISVTTGSITGNSVAMGTNCASGYYANPSTNNTLGVCVGQNDFPLTTTGLHQVAVGSNSGLLTTTGGNLLLLGTGIDKTGTTGGSLIMIGSGNVPVEPTSPGANNQINIENIFTVTGDGTPSTSVSKIAGILTLGSHLAATPSAPTLSGCGTSPSLNSVASDVHGTITEGTAATGCVLTFSTSYVAGVPVDCVISSPNGDAYAGYSTTATALTITNASANGDKFTYFCVQ